MTPAPWLDDGDVKLCACGCGRLAGVDSRGRSRRYVEQPHVLRGENYMAQPGAVNPFKGRHHTAATRGRLSEAASVPKPWIRGERNGMHGRTGASNPNWRGGGAPERQRLYASSDGRAFLHAVRERDGYRCTECGSARQIHVHHLRGWAEYPAGRLDPDNAVTLCREHHIARHRRGGDANE
jgi:HNH endonuclease